MLEINTPEDTKNVPVDKLKRNYMAEVQWSPWQEGSKRFAMPCDTDKPIGVAMANITEEDSRASLVERLRLADKLPLYI